MRRGLILLPIVLFLYSCDEGHDLSTDMALHEICQIAGKIIKSKMVGHYKVNQRPCSIRNRGENHIEIVGNYSSAENSLFQYTARGTLNDRLLLIDEIKLDGINKDFIPFHTFHLSSQ